MANPTTERFIDSLTSDEIKDVIDTLQKRLTTNARNEALSYANLLVSTLKVAGRPDLAADIANTMREI